MVLRCAPRVAGLPDGNDQQLRFLFVRHHDTSDEALLVRSLLLGGTPHLARQRGKVARTQVKRQNADESRRLVDRNCDHCALSVHCAPTSSWLRSYLEHDAPVLGAAVCRRAIQFAVVQEEHAARDPPIPQAEIVDDLQNVITYVAKAT